MIVYVIKRLLTLIPIIFGLTFVVFLIMALSPGDPTTTILGNDYTVEAGARLRQELGLDKPLVVQYFNYISRLVQGDFGKSYVSREPVMDQIAARFPSTLKIMAASMLLALPIAIPIGIYSGTKPNTLISNITLVIALLGVSLPVFWTGLLLILLFALNLGWLPSNGLDQGVLSLILPAIALGSSYIANSMRTTRSSMLECIRQDYVRTARAKGVPERSVIYDHALPNALMPTITVLGMSIGTLLGGSVVVETVFAIPGTGRFLVESINKRDTPSVLGCLVIMALCMAISNLIVDIIYAYLDPRIKAQYKTGRIE
ncbi:MAG: ABC transporter permease [Oscillospiraceae bacterium]|nr:ABC transporter permease [Oscillospiraceae bacterium]